MSHVVGHRGDRDGGVGWLNLVALGRQARLLGCLVIAVGLTIGGGLARAAQLGGGAAPSIANETVVVIPRGSGLYRVFEDIQFASQAVSPQVGTLVGATQVRGLGVKVQSVAHGIAQLRGAVRTVALEYPVRLSPQTALHLVNPGEVAVLTVDVARGWRLPRSFNPSFVWAGQGPIIAGNSTVFNAYVTKAVHSGQVLSLSVAKGSPAAASSGARTARTSWPGAIDLALLALLGGASWGILYARARRIARLLKSGVSHHEVG